MPSYASARLFKARTLLGSRLRASSKSCNDSVKRRSIEYAIARLMSVSLSSGRSRMAAE